MQRQFRAIMKKILSHGGATASTGLDRCVKACRVPSSRKTIGKQQLPIISSLLTLLK
jgi:hypothetical protein